MAASFQKIYEELTALLKNKLAPHLTYHNLQHTLYVLEKVKLIARNEQVTSEELYLLKIAALFHDAGFIYHAKDHEMFSCQIAQEYLPKYGLSEAQISMVCQMIMATKLPQEPKNNLDAILADADLYNFSTRQFEKSASLLYKERLHDDPNLSRKTFDEQKWKLVLSHRYHTQFCRLHREKLKRKPKPLKEKIDDLQD